MDGLQSPPELSSDVQRALQQAVGQANSAFISHQEVDQSRPTRRKRTREKQPADEVELVNQKKRKKRASEVVHTSPQGSPFITALDQPGPRLKKRRKASKQSTQVVTEADDINELPVDISSQSQSPSAFLNAVVAAATATAPPGSSSNFSPACLDAPPPYTAFASDPPSSAAAFQSPVPFSTVAVPDLECASNDDIIRALQDLDVTKIATVLKTLGEAAAAANIPLTSLSSIITQRPPPTLISSAPSNPVVTTGRPTRRVSQHNSPRANVSSQQEPLAHSDHANLLATKWLSASKLAELARTQGKR